MKPLIFSMVLLFITASAAEAKDNIESSSVMTEDMSVAEDISTTEDIDATENISIGNDTVIINHSEDSTAMTYYDRRIFRYRRLWNFLIPTQTIIQYAGNMGLISAGIGWDYGNRRQHETNLLFGYLPRFDSKRAKITMTIKQNFVPWRLPVGNDFNVEPLSCGLYLNTVFGHEFWGREPNRYPDKYYEFLSTKVRVNVFVGQRITAVVPHNRRKFMKSLTAFYEISTCDIYLRTMFQDSKISLWNIIGLSVGLKIQTM